MLSQAPCNLPRHWRAPLVAVVLAAVAAWTAVPHVAHAGPGESEARANAVYKDAKERLEAKDFAKAVELATQAEKIFAHPAITLLKGRALRAIGRLREAEEALKVARDKESALPKPLKSQLIDELLGVAEEMRKKGELRIAVSPADARVLVDGVQVELPFERWIAPGRHRVEAGAANRKAISRDVEVRIGDTVTVQLDLRQRDGRLVVVVPGGLQGVEVRIDGAPIEIDAGVRLGDRLAPRDLAPGRHEVVCFKGGKQVGSQLEVSADATVEARCEGLPSGEGGGVGAARKALGWSGVAVGTGLFGYGVYGLGSYLVSDLGDPRGIKSTNKHWLGSTYTVVGATAAVLSYLFFVRDNAQAVASSPPPVPAGGAHAVAVRHP